MDKKPVPSTVLPATYLQTSTPASFLASLNFSSTEHTEDTKFSSVVLPPLTTDPASTPDVPPQASPVPLVKPAQEISIKDAVRVFCEIEKIVLAIQKEFLDQESIPESSLYLGEPRCNVSISNGTHAVLQAGWSECGTEIETVSPLRQWIQRSPEIFFFSLLGGELGAGWRGNDSSLARNMVY